MRHSLNPTVVGVDNRGNTEHPYGFVYFSDGNRLLFGDTVSGHGPYGLSKSNWGALPRSPYFEIAEYAIRDHLGLPEPETETDGDDDDEICDTCGCSANEFATDCECPSPGCPANCYNP